MSSSPQSLPVLGWREWLSIPSLEIPHIKAKIDTGARTSALHTFNLETYTSGEGDERVRFSVHPFQDDLESVISCDCRVSSSRLVRDSGGNESIRPFIEVPIRLGVHEWEIEVSLTKRDNMKFRMLLGRTALKERFLVDPTLSYLQSQRYSPPTSSSS